jgi:hypothetical protein
MASAEAQRSFQAALSRGDFAAVEHAIRANLDDADALRQYLFALLTVSQSARVAEMSAPASGVPPSALVAVMRAHVSDVDLQRKSLMLLARLTQPDEAWPDEACARRVRDAGALDAAAAALRLHGAVNVVQVAACVVLRLLARTNSADAVDAAVEAMLQALVALLRAPDASPDSLRLALGALCNLAAGAATAAFAARAGELGAVEALVCVLRARAAEAEVQEKGWSLLNVLAFQHDENLARAARADAGGIATDAALAHLSLCSGDTVAEFGAQLSAIRAAEEAAAATPDAQAAAAAQKERQQRAAREVRRADACARVRLAWAPASTV